MEKQPSPRGEILLYENGGEKEFVSVVFQDETFWLTREERDDPAFRESLKPIYQQYKDQKYLVAVFLSGEEDLYQQTRDLLLYNRRRLAEKEVQAEKQAGLVMGS